MKVAFLDRDGVINKEVNYLYRIEDLCYVPGSLLAMKHLNKIGFKIIIVTNQAGIAKGYFSDSEYQIFTKHLQDDLKKNGIEILKIYYCPHHPDAKIKKYQCSCTCRKPKPGMLLKSIRTHSVDIKRSFLVGDKVTDVLAGKAVGLNKCFLVESGHKLEKSNYENFVVFKNLHDVVFNANI
jgi:D-glycero-D-manno-heptose 1,7-bisphosphate phosphatase